MGAIELIKERTRNQGHTYRPDDNVYRISQLAYCQRKQMFDKVANEKRDAKTESVEGAFALGNAIHEWTQEKLSWEDEQELLRQFEKFGNYMVAKELPIIYNAGSFKLFGHVDILFFTEKGLKVSDLKTTKIKSLYYIDKDGANIHHKVQANTYAEILGVRQYSLIYIVKETFEMREKEYLSEPDAFQLLLQNVNYLHQSIIEQQLIDRLPDFPRNWECQYKTDNETVRCDFFRLCRFANSWEDIAKYNPLTVAEEEL